MGSPCSHSRQLNGMGGGISSLSKICVVDRSKEPHTVEMTFNQVGIKDGIIDSHGTCGNLMSAVPLFAIQEGLVEPCITRENEMSVFVRDVNTAKTIRTTFPMLHGDVHWNDKFEISGVDGFGLRVATEYLSCGGSKTGHLWPTGHQKDNLILNGKAYPATLIDGPNAAIFIAAKDVVPDSVSVQEHLGRSDILEILEQLRLLGTVRMGIARTIEDAKHFKAIPKICLLETTTSGEDGIRATTLSMETVHKAIPMTIGLSLAIAMATKNTIPHLLSSGKRIHHPTGYVDVEASIDGSSGVSATVLRSVKRLMTGEVYL